MTNYLPPIPQSDADTPGALSAYRQLGAMALLDIDYWEGVSEQSLGTYYDDCLKHMQDGTLLTKLDEERRPVGYATWTTNKEGPSIVHVQRQAAPFGDHLALQKALVRHLPDGAQLISHHRRSAREAQLV